MLLGDNPAYIFSVFARTCARGISHERHGYTDVVFTTTTYCDSLLAPTTLLCLGNPASFSGSTAFCMYLLILIDVLLHGLHAWDHHRWQAHVAHMSRVEIRQELRRGVETLSDILGRSLTYFAAPGCRSTAIVLEEQRELGLTYHSDCRGHRIGD